MFNVILFEKMRKNLIVINFDIWKDKNLYSILYFLYVYKYILSIIYIHILKITTILL